MNVAFLIILVISAVYAEKCTIFSSDINISERCRTAIQRLSTLQATKPQLMARYWDSWGKPSDGILTGHTAFLGYYDECISLKNTDLGDMKYCIYPMVMDINIAQKPRESENGVCHSSNCPLPVNTSSVLNVKVGVCYPAVCSANEFAVVLSKMNISSVTTMLSDPFSDTTNTLIIKLNSTEDTPSFCPVTDVEYDAGTIAVIALCVLLVGLVMVGTIVDIVFRITSSNSVAIAKSENLTCKQNNTQDVNNRNQSGFLHKKIINNSLTIKDVIVAFSLHTTVSNLLMRQSPSALKALGGIKIISILIIITFHVQQYIYFPIFS